MSRTMRPWSGSTVIEKGASVREPPAIDGQIEV
jgi:hypothetical protein